MFSFNCVNLGWEGLTASGAYVAAAVDLDENYSNVEAELGSILRAMDAIVHNKGVATVNHPTLEGKKLQVGVSSFSRHTLSNFCGLYLQVRGLYSACLEYSGFLMTPPLQF